MQATWSQPPKISSITILDSLRPFQLFYNVRTMAPIAQPYSLDTCRIGSGAFSTLGWAESRFGIDFLVVIFSIVVISIVVVSIICATYFPLFASFHLPPAAMMITTLSLWSSLFASRPSWLVVTSPCVVILSSFPS